MQVAVPQYGPALREWLTRDESEGHVSGLRPLSAMGRCTCRAKAKTPRAEASSLRKLLRNQGLNHGRRNALRLCEKSHVLKKCITLHIHCMPMPPKVVS